MNRTSQRIVPVLLLGSACTLQGAVGEIEAEGSSRLANFLSAAEDDVNVASPGDVDGDGYSDLIVVFAGLDAPSRLCWYFGSADGVPPLTQEHADRCILVPQQVSAYWGDRLGQMPIWPMPLGDVDNDGDPDVALWAAEEGQDVRLYFFSGGPHTRHIRSIEDADRQLIVDFEYNEAWPVGVGDLDGDGRKDIVARTQAPLEIVEGNLSRGRRIWTVQAAALLDADGPDFVSPTPVGEFESERSEVYSQAVQAVEGGRDVVVGRIDGAASAARFSTIGLDAEPSRFEMGGHPAAFLFTDLDCDGTTDLISTDPERGEIRTHPNADTTQAPLTLSSGGRPVSVYSAGDADGDGCPDLAVFVRQGEFPGGPRTHLQIVHGGPQPQLGDRFEVRYPPVWDTVMPVAAGGDLNGDGFDDLTLVYVGPQSNEERGIRPTDSVTRTVLYYGGPRGEL